MVKPIIGVVEWPYKDEDGDLIYEVLTPVISKISLSGGQAMGIFPTQVEDYQNKRLREIAPLTNAEIDDLDNILSMCDAIVKPGATKTYGYETYIYRYCYEHNIPYLGICAGMQMMANYGRVIDNVRNEDNGIAHHSKEEYAHKLKIIKNTLLYDILGKEEIMVNSKHNYHISSEGIHSISAVSEDGIIEAIEAKDKEFQLGVQWHPELLNDENTAKIFDALVNEADVYRRVKKQH